MTLPGCRFARVRSPASTGFRAWIMGNGFQETASRRVRSGFLDFSGI
jgi:hypothetical protein